MRVVLQKENQVRDMNGPLFVTWTELRAKYTLLLLQDGSVTSFRLILAPILTGFIMETVYFDLQRGS